jgi:hypothetical protein
MRSKRHLLSVGVVAVSARVLGSFGAFRLRTHPRATRAAARCGTAQILGGPQKGERDGNHCRQAYPSSTRSINHGNRNGLFSSDSGLNEHTPSITGTKVGQRHRAAAARIVPEPDIESTVCPNTRTSVNNQ